MGWRDWLQLFRAQTAPADAIPLTIGAWIASHDWGVTIYVWMISIVLHFASFGHNSLMDYLMGFDRSDPSKAHHPLPAGRISPVAASWVIHSLLFASLGLMGLLAIHSHSLPGLMLLLCYAVWGYAYNNGLDHLTEWSWIPISLAFGFAAPMGYALARSPQGYFDWWIITLFWAWGFTIVAYQIAFEGNLKDVFNPSERNPLKRYCEVADKYVYCSKSLRLFYVVRLVSLGIATVIAYSLGVNVLYLLAVLVVFAYLEARLHLRMMRGHRDDILEKMGLQEVIAYYHLLVTLLPVAPYPVLALMAFGVTWFIAMNRLLWGGTTGPRV